LLFDPEGDVTLLIDPDGAVTLLIDPEGVLLLLVGVGATTKVGVVAGATTTVGDVTGGIIPGMDGGDTGDVLGAGTIPEQQSKVIPSTVGQHSPSNPKEAQTG
jgi:hypothetical protein